MISLLVAGMAMQWMTNAVARGAIAISGFSLAQSSDGPAAFMADVVQSVCSTESGKLAQGNVPDCFCQFCVPAVHHFTSNPGGQLALSLAAVQDAGPWGYSQTLPVSRRLPGDGFSRAPPFLA
ncbi:MAG: hypothetical protein HY055_09840 [Magnetospirillum sp.]|nr:hypothetical protein [Magnetospirillum sp.]